MDEFEKELAQVSEQNSDLWFAVRAGRFTSSKMYNLIASGTRLMTAEELKNRPKSGAGSSAKLTEDPSKFSEKGERYIYEVVSEVLTGMSSPQGFSYATQHGDEMEPFAAKYYEEKFGVETEMVSFKPFGDHAGGSPDRKIKGIEEGLEIKCPYNPVNQIEYLMLTDQWDLKRLYPDYYWQCMSNLLFTGWDKIHFVTYDHRFTLEKHKMSHIEITPNSKEFDIITGRLAMAIKLKLEILNSLK